MGCCGYGRLMTEQTAKAAEQIVHEVGEQPENGVHSRIRSGRRVRRGLDTGFRRGFRAGLHSGLDRGLLGGHRLFRSHDFLRLRRELHGLRGHGREEGTHGELSLGRAHAENALRLRNVRDLQVREGDEGITDVQIFNRNNTEYSSNGNSPWYKNVVNGDVMTSGALWTAANWAVQGIYFNLEDYDNFDDYLASFAVGRGGCYNAFTDGNFFAS